MKNTIHPATGSLYSDGVYHKEAFGKIAPEKQERILLSAIREFAAKGFTAANINTIARNAQISIGALYNYFDSKEALFLAVNNKGYEIIEQTLAGTDMEEGDIYDKFQRLFKAAQTYSRMHRELNQIYLDISSEGMAHLSRRLSRKMETITAEFFRKMIDEGKKEGTVAANVDTPMAAFGIDNLIVMLQYAYTSEYHSERMRIFAGDDALENDERVLSGMMRFVRGALAPSN